MIEGGNLVPSAIAEEAIGDGCGAGMSEGIAHHVRAAAGQAESALAGRGESVPGTQALGDRRAGQLRSHDAGDAALGAEYRRARHATPATPAMLVPRHRGAELIAALHRLLVKPAEMPPGRTDLHQPLQLGVVPVEIAASSSDMRDEEMRFRRPGIGGP